MDRLFIPLSTVPTARAWKYVGTEGGRMFYRGGGRLYAQDIASKRWYRVQVMK